MSHPPPAELVDGALRSDHPAGCKLMGFRGLLLAPPGAGKGTQGEVLSDRMGLVHIATGDLLRHHVAQGDRIGSQAKQYMQAGELVPDELVVKMVFQRLSSMDPDEGLLLDGFPRTLPQARQLYERGQRMERTFHAVISLDVPEDELIRRLVERGRNSGRSDDNESVIAHRQRVYQEETQPLMDYYRERGILHHVDGTGSIEEVANRVEAVVRATYHD